MARVVAVFALVTVVACGACASLFADKADALPSSPESWKAYAHRWGKTSQAALEKHLGRVWGCRELEVKPIGVGTLSDEDGIRVPTISWSAAGCEHQGLYVTACPAAPALGMATPGPGEVACDVKRKRETQAMPGLITDLGGVVVVTDVGAR